MSEPERVQLDPYVRQVDEVTDMDGVPLPFGVDHDCVTIGPHCFTAGQMEEVGRALMSAVWQAGQQKAQMDGGPGG